MREGHRSHCRLALARKRRPELLASGVTEAWEGPSLCPCHLRTVEIGPWGRRGWGEQAPVGRGSIRDQSQAPRSRACAGSQGSPPPPAAAPPWGDTFAWSCSSWALSAQGEGTWAEGLDSLLWVTRRVNCGAHI